MILFIHIPKTAGISFRKGLEEIYSDRLCKDYSDSIFDSWRRREDSMRAVYQNRAALICDYDVIYGNFPVPKYSLLNSDGDDSTLFCTLLRDPVDRVISEYRSLTTKPDPQRHAKNMTLTEFAGSYPQRKIYSLFTKGMPLYQFAFIGITEEYTRSLDLFAQIFNIRIPYYNINVSPGSKLDLDARERQEIETILKDNYRIYNDARRLFDERCKEFHIS